MKEKKQLDQTQVLNLQDIQEKSKAKNKNRMLFLVLITVGIFLIGAGIILMVTTNNISSLNQNNQQNNTNSGTTNTDSKNKNSVLTCIYKQSSNGVSMQATTTFAFENQLLKSYIAKLDATSENQTPEELQVLLILRDVYSALGQTLSQSKGYEGSLSLENYMLNVSIGIDLTVFDINILKQADTSRTYPMDFSYQQPFTEVKANIERHGYICQ